MDAKSQEKVVRAGFTIIRKDDYPQPRIKIKNFNGGDWKTFLKFETKAARNRKFNELIEDPSVITD